METSDSTPRTTNQPSSDWFDLDYPSAIIVAAMAALLLVASGSTLRSHNPIDIAAPPDCVRLIPDEKRLGCYDHAFHRIPSAVRGTAAGFKSGRPSIRPQSSHG